MIITSATYLISLICNESDDGDYSDSLSIDTRDFTTTPSVSPAEPSNNVVANSKSNELADSQNDSVEPKKEKTEELQPTVDDQNYLNEVDSTCNKSADSKESLTKAAVSKDSTIQENKTNNLWTSAVATQKSIITNQLGAPASKQLFDEFDQKEMQHGGTGLHWCKTRESLDKLIKLGVPLDVVNSKRETALHVAIRKRKLQVLIGLVCSGANVESRNENGETPLILSCKVNDIYACQLLLVFDANPNAEDNFGSTGRHYVASICDKHKSQQQLPSAAHLILAMLHEMGAHRCLDQSKYPEKLQSSQNSDLNKGKRCTDGCSSTGSYNGNSYNRWPDFQKESLYKRHMFSDIIQNLKSQKLDELDRRKRMKQDKEAPTSSRLLCIDGGGMRGIIVCQIMIELEKYLKKSMIDYFDWIGGTSAGAFISCALCTGSSLAQLRHVCFDAKDEVFTGVKPYNAKFLEKFLKRIYGVSTRMSNVKDKKLAVTTVIADRDPCQLRFFRNYKSPDDLLESNGYKADIFNNMSGHSLVSRKQVSSSSKSSKTVSKSIPQPLGNAIMGKSTHKEVLNSSSSVNRKRNLDADRVQAKESLPPSKDKDDVPVEEAFKQTAKEIRTDHTIADNIIAENELDPLIWQAVRASGAAPFFFKPYGPYLDGGIISNNPTLDMLTEFYDHERFKRFLRSRTDENVESQKLKIDLEPPSRLELVVSLGTGRGRVIGKQAMIDFGNVASGFATVFSPVELLRSIRAARDLFKKLMQQSCQTEDHILDRAQAWCSSLDVPYFRINPPLATIFSIDDKRDEQLINALWQTKLYMKAISPQLKELGELLDGPSEKITTRTVK